MSVVTMADVAKAAKVSRPTVSLVLNGNAEKWRVSDRTSTRVLKVAERLGYRKNLIARSMVTGKTEVIGIVGLLDDSFGAEILRGISEVADINGYSLKYFRGESPEEIAMIAKKCVGQRLSGVICHLNDFDPSISQELATANIPMVHVDNCGSDGSFSCVGSDDFAGAVQAVEHLHRLGHRRIAHLAGDLDYICAKIRYDGYRAGLAKCGLDFSDDLLWINNDHDAISEDFRRMMGKILSEVRPTALFCGGDAAAMKALKIAVETGVKVPEDLSIVGFAGLAYTQWTVPALTTVRQPFVEMGRGAAEILLSEIKEGAPHQEMALPVELLIRQSTSKAKSSRFTYRNRYEKQERGLTA